MISSFCATRMVGRVSRAAMLRFGYLLMSGAAAVLWGLQLLRSDLPIPLQQVLLFCMAFGAQFTFPVLTLEMLDLYPRSRGATASVSSFIALGCGALVMGFLAPALQGVLPNLALAALIGGAVGYGLWVIAGLRLRARAALDSGHGH
jgi:DHA1 family bicyclomycin/chloramphenicol resistance-like MFS transporter